MARRMDTESKSHNRGKGRAGAVGRFATRYQWQTKPHRGPSPTTKQTTREGRAVSPKTSKQEKQRDQTNKQASKQCRQDFTERRVSLGNSHSRHKHKRNKNNGIRCAKKGRKLGQKTGQNCTFYATFGSYHEVEDYFSSPNA